MKYILLFLIKIYQKLFSFDHGIPHKLFPGYRVCIYYPSCSEYGYESIRRYGTFIGGWLTFKRIMRCGPWADGGNDPVKDVKLNWVGRILRYF